MKIAIHNRPGSFSDRWIAFCKKQGINYKEVNAYDNDIVQQLSDCDAFMWHHNHENYRDVLFARQLIYSLESKGIRCFPNFYTTWHFDDKVGQKYLLEAVKAPIVPSYVFYDKREALNWVDSTSFPKVFKLRGGAGASNVKLAHTASEARRFVKIAFGKGFPQYDRFGSLKERYRKWKEGKVSFVMVLKGLGRLIKSPEFTKMHGVEKGYAYFQDFVPNNTFDIRVIVIGNKAFAIKRLVRKDDFRASGSGHILYDRSELPEDCVRISFETSKKLKTQCIGFDFVRANGYPQIVEMSYGFAIHGYDPCPGYWTEDMHWHEGAFNPQEWMVQEVIKEAR